MIKGLEWFTVRSSWFKSLQQHKEEKIFPFKRVLASYGKIVKTRKEQ